MTSPDSVSREASGLPLYYVRPMFDGVHERAIIQVVLGSVELTHPQGVTTCRQGAVVLLEPGERHAVRASEASRILLTLAPWPGRGHYDPSETHDPHRLPAHATALEQA